MSEYQIIHMRATVINLPGKHWVTPWHNMTREAENIYITSEECVLLNTHRKAMRKLIGKKNP